MRVMKILVPIGKSKNVIATIAIGGDYYDEWFENAYPSWKRYCEKNELGLIVFNKDLISKDNKFWKKATWQKMLIAEYVKESDLSVENICYLDTDILINHNSPNIFDSYDTKTIGLVSQERNIPFSLSMIQRRISFLRHIHYDNKYPLDSAIFMSKEQVFKYHGILPQSDYACMGLLLFNVDNHSMLMRSWFDKYDCEVQSLTGGDEPLINFEIQTWGGVTWLDYKFQALWNYEISMKYPFLYNFGRNNIELIKECIEASLMSNYFVHFAGSWHESDMWKNGDIFDSEEKQKELEYYYDYLKIPVTGKPIGIIKP